MQMHAPALHSGFAVPRQGTGKTGRKDTMNTNSKKVSHKLGANRNEIAKKVRRSDHNFAQSRDIHEDRGARRMKSTGNPRSFVTGR